MEQLAYNFPDENAQLAEAIEVVRHAVWKSGRGGRQGARGRNPSMHYSASRSRNPKECLRRAYEDLGFVSLRDAKVWLQDQPTDWSRKLDLKLKPKILNIEGGFTISSAVVRLDYPTRVQKFLKHLNESDLADVRPLIFGIRDATGKRSRLMMRIMSDPRPQEQGSVLLDGRLIMRRGQAVSCLDGQTHPIFPGSMARLHIDPEQSLCHVEFLDVIKEETSENYE